MPSAQIFCLSEDAVVSGQLRVDLERRGWSVFLTLFGSAPKIGTGSPDSTFIGWLPHRVDRHSDLIGQLAIVGAEAQQTLILVPGEVTLPGQIPLPPNATLLVVDAFDYDRTFEDIFRALHAPWPTWLDVRVRPSQLTRPTGVGWWSEDLVVADERFEHVVRIGPDNSTVLLPGLSEPQHVDVDRRQLLVANKGGDEIVVASLVDDMASEVGCVRNIEGEFAHPHAARQAQYHVAIADTDHHRVLLGAGQLHRSEDIAWTVIGGLSGPCDISLSQGLLLVADTFSHRVLAYDLDGSALGVVGQYGVRMGDFSYPVGVTTWRDYVFVSDEEGKRLQVLQMQRGRNVVDFTPIGMLARSVIRSPFGLDVNRENRLAVSDRDRRCVWLVDIEPALKELTWDG